MTAEQKEKQIIDWLVNIVLRDSVSISDTALIVAIVKDLRDGIHNQEWPVKEEIRKGEE